MCTYTDTYLYKLNILYPKFMVKKVFHIYIYSPTDFGMLPCIQSHLRDET